MIGLRVDSNVDRVKLRFNTLQSGIEEKATLRALNRAGDQAVTAASREIRRTYNISAAKASQQIKVRDRARPGKLSFTIRIFGSRINLIEFVRGSKSPTVGRARAGRGISVEIKKGQRKLIPHAFIAKMKSGHVGVFVRARPSTKGFGLAFRHGRGSRIRKWPQADAPIVELTTLAVPRMFTQRAVRTAVARIAIESFRRNFAAQVKFLTGDWGYGAAD